MKTKEKKTKTLRFDKDILKKLENLARLDKRSLNKFIEIIFEQYLLNYDDLLNHFDQKKNVKK